MYPIHTFFHNNGNVQSTERTASLVKISAFLIFLIIFCTLGLPFTEWGFKTDDWGNVYHSIIKNWYDFITFFVEGNSEKVYHPCNVPPCQEAFFQGLYRPMSFIYYYIQYCFFGTNPYGYFLVSVGFHALNAVLLFLLLLSIASTGQAFVAALFFGFHPSLWNWLGWTSAQTYFIELFILLVMLLLLKKYLETDRFLFYTPACLLFLLNLFLKEQSIFFPLWVLFLGLITTRKISKAFKLSAGFWLVALFYVITRLQFFPLTKATKTLTFEPTWQSFLTRMSSRFYDFVTYINDLLGLSWLPGGNQTLKGFVIITIFVVGSYLFWYCTKKGLVLFAIASIPLFSWPAIIMHYQPRYIYLALPWILFITLVLVNFSYLTWHLPKKMLLSLSSLCMMVIVLNGNFLYQNLAKRQQDLHIITQAFINLAHNSSLKNRAVCFLALPERWFKQGTTQAIWMLKNSDAQPIFQYDVTMNHLDGHLDDNYLVMDRCENLFTLSSTNTTRLWFAGVDGTKKNNASIAIDDTISVHKPLFVTWNYITKQFRILDE